MEGSLERLIIAARSGDLEGVKENLSVENMNSLGPLSMTALGEACRAGHTDVVKFLLESGADVGDVLHLVCEYKVVDLVDVMLASEVPVDTLDKYGRTPLFVAVERQSLKVVEALLRKGASVNKVDRRYCRSPLYKACETECPAIANALLESGASVNLKSTSSFTPLHVACGNNRSLSVIESLLKHGASVNEVDRLGDTPLHLACERGRLDMVRLLLQHGASVNIPNRRHLTPIRVSFDYDPIISVLLAYGAGSGRCSLYYCSCGAGPELQCVYQEHESNRSVDAFEKHLVKVRTAGLHYLINNLWQLDDTFSNWTQQDRDIFRSQCLAEIDQLKNRKVYDNGSSTYHDLLRRNKSVLRDEKIIGSWRPEVLKEFPIYGDFIYSSYLKIPECIKRRELICECSVFFELTMFAGLPPELVPLILEHLPNEDLEHLVEIISRSDAMGRTACTTDGIAQSNHSTSCVVL